MLLPLSEVSLANATWFAVRLLHVLASAAMFGAMFYSITVIQPRARRYFQNPQDLEEFVAFISNGARWKVLSGFGLLGASGLALLIFHHEALNRTGTALMIAKIFILLVAVSFFCFVSWRLWPARIFATPEEIPRFQRIFRRVGFTMIAMMTIEFLLATLAHVSGH